MPRTKISEYSTTNSDNTDIESININEGCAPSGINNAIRELMVHLKEFQTGASSDPLTVAGTFVASGGATIAASAGTSASPSIHFSGDTNTGIFSPAADTIAFAEGGAEAMRITSAGEVIVGGTTGAIGGIGLTVESVTNPEIALFRNDTTVVSGNLLGAINFYGNDTTSNIPTPFAQISARASGTHGAGDNPTDIVFFTTPDNSSTVTEVVRFTQAGKVGIGTDAPVAELTVIGDVSASNVIVTNGADANAIVGNTGRAYANFYQVGASTGGYVSFHTTPTTSGSLAERMRITSDGEVLVGGTTSTTNIYSVSDNLTLQSVGGGYIGLFRNDTSVNINNPFGAITWYGNDTTSNAVTALAYIQAIAANTHAAGDNPTDLVFGTTPDGSATVTERMRITSEGDAVFNKTAVSITTVGAEIVTGGTTAPYIACTNTTATASATSLLRLNRQSSDGDLVSFRQADVQEGLISVSGTTVTYGGGHLARFGQLLDGSKDESLKKGTVLSNLDEMCVWSAPTTYWTEEDKLPVDEEGNPTVAVGDVKKEAYTADNEQCNKIKVSDVEGDANVAGVFVSWNYDEQHNTNDLFVAMTGDMIIRIAQGVVVQKGDLLMSAGDGTAKPQGDDIVRSKTVAKVTSNHVTCTYADGSYCVPCVLMAC